MPPAKKDITVVLYDLKTSELNKKLYLKIILNRTFSEQKDEFQVIFLNCKNTKNRLSYELGGYEKIYETTEEMGQYGPNFFLEAVESSEIDDANWIEGLEVATKALEDAYERSLGVVTLKLLLLTDFPPEIPNVGDGVIATIAKKLNSMQAFVYVIGPDITPPFQIKSHIDVKNWMDSVNFDGTENPNLKIIKQIFVLLWNRVICNPVIGLHLFYSYKNWAGSQPWKVPLKIGTELQVPCQTMKLLNEKLIIKTNSKGGRHTGFKWVDAEDESVEIPSEDVIGGITRHGKFIQMPDDKMFKCFSSRGLDFICFTDSSNVPEYFVKGAEAYCTISDGDDEIFHILIDSLAKQKKYVIARRVYASNFNPKLVVLIPKPQLKCFYVGTLPFADNLVRNYKEEDVKSAPKSEVLDEVSNFLDSFEVDYIEQFPLGFQMLFDINYQKVSNKGGDKLLGRNLNLDQLDLDYSVIGFNNETPAADALKQLFIPKEAQTVEERGGNSSDQEEMDW